MVKTVTLKEKLMAQANNIVKIMDSDIPQDTREMMIKTQLEYLDMLFNEVEEKLNQYKNALREIDAHIRLTPEPIPYIIETLKNTLPEYKV